jgi:hypothetical protein
MKYIICTAACLLIISVLLSFAFNTVLDNLNTDTLEENSEKVQSGVSTDKPTSKPTDNYTDKATQSKPAETSKPSNTDGDNGTDKATDSNNATSEDDVATIYRKYGINTSNPPAALEHTKNGVINKVYTGDMSLATNIQFLKSHNATADKSEETSKLATVMYLLDGDIKNWVIENDIIYVITANNNTLVAIDSQTMTPLYNTPLSGIPGEISIIENKIYVSLYSLHRIDIFSKSDGKKVSFISLENEAYSFAIYDNYIFYSEASQHCKVFRKNILNNETVTLPQTFYYPKIYVNHEDGLLYIGESHCSGSRLYYLDANTLLLKSSFAKNNYGISNNTREIFHVNDMVFWGNYCFSDTNATAPICVYGRDDIGEVIFASEDYVSTRDGIYVTDTTECIIKSQNDKYYYHDIIITKSYNVFLKTHLSTNANVLIGINLNLQ